MIKPEFINYLASNSWNLLKTGLKIRIFRVYENFGGAVFTFFELIGVKEHQNEDTSWMLSLIKDIGNRFSKKNPIGWPGLNPFSVKLIFL